MDIKIIDEIKKHEPIQLGDIFKDEESECCYFVCKLYDENGFQLKSFDGLHVFGKPYDSLEKLQEFINSKGIGAFTLYSQDEYKLQLVRK